MDSQVSLKDLKDKILLLRPKLYLVSTEFGPPRMVSKVHPADTGLQLSVSTSFTVPFLSISYLSIFGMKLNGENELFLDIFLARRSHSFRVPMEGICYEEFFASTHNNITNNFRSFVLNLLMDSTPVYIDEPTASYLMDYDPWIFKTFDDPHVYCRSIWSQIMYMKKVLCETCSSMQWNDIREINSQTICASCGEKESLSIAPIVEFAKFLTGKGCTGKELVNKLAQIVKLEQSLGVISLKDVGREQLANFTENLNTSGVNPETIQSFGVLMKEFVEFSARDRGVTSEITEPMLETSDNEITQVPMTDSTEEILDKPHEESRNDDSVTEDTQDQTPLEKKQHEDPPPLKVIYPTRPKTFSPALEDPVVNEQSSLWRRVAVKFRSMIAT